MRATLLMLGAVSPTDRVAKKRRPVMRQRRPLQPPRKSAAQELVHQLMEARDERRLLKLQAQLAAVKLLIVDELG